MQKYFKLFLIIIVIGSIGIWLGTRATFLLVNNNKIADKSTVIAYSSTPIQTPTPTPIIGIPVTLYIPKISVNVSLESVGMDSLGRMDVPKDANHAAWYNLGYKPGEVGNSVIDGHLDTPYGPSIFYNLSSLTSGDEIIITDSNGGTKKFKVTQTVSYPFDRLPMNQVFGSSDKSHLNLITCGGIWNQVARNYSNRVVVYSNLES